MKTTIEGSAGFRYLQVVLEPREGITTENGAMSSMEGGIALNAKLNGSIGGALAKQLLGKESLFISQFNNTSSQEKTLCLSPKWPGDIFELDLKDTSLCLQPGAFFASTSNVDLKLRWKGISFFMAGEGFFGLTVQGTGKVWISSFGAIIRQQVQEEITVDTGHLVAFESHLALRTSLAGGVLSSVFNGEGITSKITGTGAIYIQSRSDNGLAKWITPQLS
jgi:uncharacterized protein (TIGR00266 family)